VDGARAALAGVTPDVGAREPGQLADVMDQKQPWLDIVGVLGAVDGHGDGCFHRTYLLDGAGLVSGDEDSDAEICRDTSYRLNPSPELDCRFSGPGSTMVFAWIIAPLSPRG